MLPLAKEEAVKRSTGGRLLEAESAARRLFSLALPRAVRRTAFWSGTALATERVETALAVDFLPAAVLPDADLAVADLLGAASATAPLALPAGLTASDLVVVALDADRPAARETDLAAGLVACAAA
jgi:hypothetical protein